MFEYDIYYVSKENRLESMMVCSLSNHIDWCENGLKIVSWTYNKVASGSADNLNEVFKKYLILNIDRRKKKQMRTICIGDVIVFDDTPWLITGFGFSSIPDILWKKIMSTEKVHE